MTDSATDKQIRTIDELVPYLNNSRTHNDAQIEQLARSIGEFGFVGAIVHRDGVIAKGHGCMAAIKLLLSKGNKIYPAPGRGSGAKPFTKNNPIPTIDASGWSDEQFKAYVIADNQLALNAGWNEELLKMELMELKLAQFDIELIGFDQIFLNELLLTESKQGLTGDEEIPELPSTSLTKPGHIWSLGDHRLMCGDSTHAGHVGILMNKEKADITFCSPPYNIGVSTLDTHIVAGEKSKGSAKYQNDSDDLSSDDYKKLLNDYTTTALMYSDYVFSNIQSLAGNKIALIEHLYEMRNRFADTIIWNKKTAAPAMAHKVLNSQFEYIHIFSNDSKRTIGIRDFKGTLFNVIEMSSRRDKALSSVHRATFPVDFAEHFIINFTQTSCFDPFGGTGTTMIACEKTNRKCFMMELDPIYCDVIINRWQNYTGKEAIRESDGKKFNEIDKKDGKTKD